MATEITMYRGDDATFPFTLTQGGAAVDLTGAAIVFSGRLGSDFEQDDEEPVAPLILSEADGDIVILPNQSTTDKGKIEVTIPATDSVDLETAEKYLCDIEVTLAGSVWTWPEPVYGESTLIRLQIKADVTHA